MENVILHVPETAEDESDYLITDDGLGNGDEFYYYEEYNDDADGEDNSNYIYIINTILSGTARLNILLPTATILAFTIFVSLLTNDGNCTALDQWLMAGFMVLLATSCMFFSITDSFRTATGRRYYGVATLHGIKTLDGARAQPRVPSDYRLRWRDMFHGSLALIAFLTFGLLQNDVLSCYHLHLPRKFINTIPLVVGFIVSVFFVLCPSQRRGVGYPVHGIV